MSEASRKDLPVGFPPPGVPLDQTKAEVVYRGGAVQRDFARLWRKLRGLFGSSH
jgi:hypothetical protein